jgi:hypothetical protein
MIFVVSFLGALFAILAALAIVYTYVTLRVIPRLKRGIREWVEEIGPKAIFEQAKVDPAEAMRELGIDVMHPSRVPGRPDSPWIAATKPAEPKAQEVRIVYAFACEDHGRCAGCPKILAQFEAIVRNQGADSFDEEERECYERLRDQMASDARIGENEIERQKRIAARVIETLVREGCASSLAHGVVWSRTKEDRATFATWLSAARAGRESLAIADEEDVA